MTTTRRECGGCTACCFLLEVSEVQSPCFTKCQHQIEGHGCGIYATRPAPCADFGCLWIEGRAPGFVDADTDRPSNLGVAFFLFPGGPVPGRPVVMAFELRDDAVLQTRVAEIVREVGKLRPVVFVQHRTGAQMIRYPDDMREAMQTGAVVVDRTERG